MKSVEWHAFDLHFRKKMARLSVDPRWKIDEAISSFSPPDGAWNDVAQGTNKREMAGGLALK